MPVLPHGKYHCRADSKIPNTWQLPGYQKLMDAPWLLINSKTDWTLSGSFYKISEKEILLRCLIPKYLGMELILNKLIAVARSMCWEYKLHFRYLSRREYINHYMKVIWSLRKDAVKKFASKTRSKSRGMLYQTPLILMGPCFLPWFHGQKQLSDVPDVFHLGLEEISLKQLGSSSYNK